MHGWRRLLSSATSCLAASFSASAMSKKLIFFMQNTSPVSSSSTRNTLP